MIESLHLYITKWQDSYIISLEKKQAQLLEKENKKKLFDLQKHENIENIKSNNGDMRMKGIKEIIENKISVKINKIVTQFNNNNNNNNNNTVPNNNNKGDNSTKKNKSIKSTKPNTNNNNSKSKQKNDNNNNRNKVRIISSPIACRYYLTTTGCTKANCPFAHTNNNNNSSNNVSNNNNKKTNIDNNNNNNNNINNNNNNNNKPNHQTKKYVAASVKQNTVLHGKRR